jgi:hypothetical protein
VSYEVCAEASVQQMQPTSRPKEAPAGQDVLRLFVTLRKILPRLYEHPPAASAGAGKKGKSSDQPGQYWRYLIMSSWY